MFNLIRKRHRISRSAESHKHHKSKGAHTETHYNKMVKVENKERTLKYQKKLLISYKGAPKRLLNDCSAKTFQARRDRHKILKVIQNKARQQRLLYLARLPFRFEGEKKSFQNKKKLKEFIIIK